VRPGSWREALLDVSSPTAVRSLIERERPGLVMYVAYDKARHDVTVAGAQAAATAAAAAGARFLLTSTDVVFDGSTGNYNEDMPAAPVMPYGRLKLEAETAVRNASNAAVILRMSLLWGESGSTLRPAYECDNLQSAQPIDAFTDEWRSPLHVDDAARAAWDLGASETEGIYHFGGPERLSRFEMAQRLCTIHNFDASLVHEARRPEDRPADTSLDSSRLLGFLDWTPRTVAPQTLALEQGEGESIVTFSE
jgi:dTDP-4-dehydrorhamnose reductase